MFEWSAEVMLSADLIVQSSLELYCFIDEPSQTDMDVHRTDQITAL